MSGEMYSSWTHIPILIFLPHLDIKPMTNDDETVLFEDNVNFVDHGTSRIFTLMFANCGDT